MEDIAPVNLLLMANAAQSGKDIEHIFDLKGSTVNREEKDPEVATKKDTNLIKMKKRILPKVQTAWHEVYPGVSETWY